MSVDGKPIREEKLANAADVFLRVADLDHPVVFRGLVKTWPLIAKRGSGKRIDYLKQFDAGHSVTVFRGKAGDSGRIFYTDALESVNFEQTKMPFAEFADQLLDASHDDNPRTLYMGSTAIDHFFPDLSTENSLPRDSIEATVRIWIGNRTTVAAHYDAMDNIACVCAGRRRFTLFPPEEIRNLYIGPLDFTPAGQAVSLVDFDNPDYARFPQFKSAEKAALCAELEPGDAIFIPALWWHHVQGLERFNILINHWWQSAPRHVGPPLDALLHALLNIRDLPSKQRKRWKILFDHYVFERADDAADHIPEERRGAVGELDDALVRRMRAALRNNLNR